MKPDEILRILVHPGIDNDELRATMADGGFGASWRAVDDEAFDSEAMRRFLKEQRVQLIN